jgi:hypothetical protein
MARDEFDFRSIPPATTVQQSHSRFPDRILAVIDYATRHAELLEKTENPGEHFMSVAISKLHATRQKFLRPTDDPTTKYDPPTGPRLPEKELVNEALRKVKVTHHIGSNLTALEAAGILGGWSALAGLAGGAFLSLVVGWAVGVGLSPAAIIWGTVAGFFTGAVAALVCNKTGDWDMTMQLG